MVTNLVMAEVSTSWQRRLSVAAFGLAMLALVACSEEPTLPPVLSDAERPTVLEITRAPEVGLCDLNARATDYVDELVRVHATLFSGFEIGGLHDPKCEGVLLGIEFDDSRMKRLSSSATLRTLEQARREGASRDKPIRSLGDLDVLDVVFVGRFKQTQGPPPSEPHRWLIVYALERVMPLESGR